MLIKTPAKHSLKDSDVTDYDIYQRRREFMIKAGSLVAAAGVGIPSIATAKVELGDFTRDSESLLTEEITEEVAATSYNNFYELGTGKEDPKRNAHLLKTDPWTIEVEGECEKPGKIAIEDFVKPHAIEERIYRLRCVEAWSMVIPWVGIELGPVLKSFAPTSKAKYVQFETILDKEHLPGQRRNVLDWPYVEGLRMDEAMHPLAFLAVGLYGKELPNQNGAPLRLVVPWKYGFKSIKSIVKIRFVEEQPATSWNISGPREYGFYSNVNPNVSHPRWSQARERRIGDFRKRETLMFNGYEEQVASMYTGMDLKKQF